MYLPVCSWKTIGKNENKSYVFHGHEYQSNDRKTNVILRWTQLLMIQQQQYATTYT